MTSDRYGGRQLLSDSCNFSEKSSHFNTIWMMFGPALEQLEKAKLLRFVLKEFILLCPISPPHLLVKPKICLNTERSQIWLKFLIFKKLVNGTEFQNSFH